MEKIFQKDFRNPNLILKCNKKGGVRIGELKDIFVVVVI